jgi:hypothetical protein
VDRCAFFSLLQREKLKSYSEIFSAACSGSPVTLADSGQSALLSAEMLGSLPAEKAESSAHFSALFRFFSGIYAETARNSAEKAE